MSTLTQPEVDLSTASPEKQIDNKETKLNTSESEDAEPQWVTGVQLYSILAAVTLASFTIMLDTSIIATVR